MIEIMTWNTALTEDDTNLAPIIKFIKEFLDKPNTIAVLQQIPLKDPNMNWCLHQIYREFLMNFPKTDYSIFPEAENASFNNGYIYMETIIVTKMDNIEPADDKYYPNSKITNRECAIKVNINKIQDLVIMGIHAKNGNDNKCYLKSINDNPDIIVGDFNAGDYLESENYKIFKTILENHVCICNLPTKRVLHDGVLIRKSCIDHIFVKRPYVTKCSEMIIHENVMYSDHYPITFKIDI